MGRRGAGLADGRGRVLDARDQVREPAAREGAGLAEPGVPDGRGRALVLKDDGEHLQDLLGVPEEDAEDEVVLPELVGFRRDLLELRKIVEEPLQPLPGLVLPGPGHGPPLERRDEGQGQDEQHGAEGQDGRGQREEVEDGSGP